MPVINPGGSSGASAAVCVEAYKTTDQTGIAAATWTKVTFDSERIDTNSAFASSTFTAPSTGKYRVVSTMCGNSTSGAYWASSFYVNGSRVTTCDRQTNTSSTIATLTNDRILTLTAADTVDVYVYGGGVSVMNLYSTGTPGGTGLCSFSVEYMGT